MFTSETQYNFKRDNMEKIAIINCIFVLILRSYLFIFLNNTCIQMNIIIFVL